MLQEHIKICLWSIMHSKHAPGVCWTLRQIIHAPGALFRDKPDRSKLLPQGRLGHKNFMTPFSPLQAKVVLKSVSLNKINTLSVVILWLPTFWSSKIWWARIFSFQIFMKPPYFGDSLPKKLISPFQPKGKINQGYMDPFHVPVTMAAIFIVTLQALQSHHFSTKVLTNFIVPLMTIYFLAPSEWTFQQNLNNFEFLPTQISTSVE